MDTRIPLTEHHNTLVFSGKGQGKEDAGHDAFADIPYERLNKIRLRTVQADDKKVSILADLTAAYEPEIGVTEFTRQFVFTAPSDFIVTDSVKTEKPQIITSFLHSDNSITAKSKKLFEFEPNGTSLLAEIIAPKKFETKIEKNILTAPGKPGSVDKGKREERGVRLAISTRRPTNKAKFIVRLKIKN